MIPFFAERFGRKYPYSKYSQVLVDDFMFGAMENTSATTMTDRVLLDRKAAIDVDYDDIVAHELAHQWWGNLVTCRTGLRSGSMKLRDLCRASLAREHKGADEARFALFQDFMVYLREDWLSHRRPIVSTHYRFSDELLDRHAYEKGACVVSMLRHELGDERSSVRSHTISTSLPIGLPRPPISDWRSRNPPAAICTPSFLSGCTSRATLS
jgi:aminopeptidase N